MSNKDRTSTPVVHGLLHQAIYGGWWYKGQNDKPIYWADEVETLLEKMRSELAAEEQKSKRVHAQIRKIVREKLRLLNGPSVAYDNGYKDACANILAQLNAIQKGKKA